jgi:hypothetical protein
MLANVDAMSTTASHPLLHHAGSRTEAVHRTLLVCGIVSSVLYVAMNVIAGLSWQGYSFASQSISELSAIDAPSRSIWVPLGFAYGALLIAFGVGVWLSADQNRRLRVAAAMLIAIGVLGLFWPPMHLRGTVASLTDTLHIAFAIITTILIMLAIAFGAGALGQRFRMYSYASLAALVLAGLLSFADAPRLAANEPTPWLGVLERINLAIYLAWVAALGFLLLRKRA